MEERARAHHSGSRGERVEKDGGCLRERAGLTTADPGRGEGITTGDPGVRVGEGGGCLR